MTRRVRHGEPPGGEDVLGADPGDDVVEADPAAEETRTDGPPIRAVTRPLADSENPPDRGPRPVSIELASAALIVTGAIGLFGASTALPDAIRDGAGLIGLLTIGIDIASIVVGILVRRGRAWVVAINYVAVLGFLDLMASTGSQLGAILAVVDVFVFVAVFVQRGWFGR